MTENTIVEASIVRMIDDNGEIEKIKVQVILDPSVADAVFNTISNMLNQSNKFDCEGEDCCSQCDTLTKEEKKLDGGN
jgi:hypothetical protein